MTWELAALLGGFIGVVLVHICLSGMLRKVDWLKWPRWVCGFRARVKERQVARLTRELQCWLEEDGRRNWHKPWQRAEDLARIIIRAGKP